MSGPTLEPFGKVVGKRYVEDITREDLVAWIAALRKKRERTPNHPQPRRLIPDLPALCESAPLPKGKDLPQFTQKKVRAYNPDALDKLFEHASKDESDLLHFLLCTGAREQEAQFACWPDVDLERKTYTVTEHLDLAYRLKDKEERTLPIPYVLVEVLRERRKRNPRSRLIFPGPQGGVKGTHGLSAQILKRYLRHSDVSTTIACIAGQPDDQVRDTINSPVSRRALHTTRSNHVKQQRVLDKPLRWYDCGYRIYSPGT